VHRAFGVEVLRAGLLLFVDAIETMRVVAHAPVADRKNALATFRAVQ